MKQVATFKERLKEALDIKGIRPIELSKATNISKSLISRYLNGTTLARQDKFQDIADFLNVSYAWLMGYDVPMVEAKTTKQRIINSLDSLSENQLQDIEKFIKTFILKWGDNT